MPAACGHREFGFAGGFIVHGKPDRFRLVAVERRDRVFPSLFDVHRVVAPFTVARPANVELVRSRGEEIRMAEVRKVLGVRNVHAFFLSESPEIRRGVRPLMVWRQVELATAVIDVIDVVLHDSLATEIEVGAFDLAGNGLWAALVERVGEWLSFVVRREGRGDLHRITRPKLRTRNKAESHHQTENEKGDLHGEQLMDEVILIKPKRAKRHHHPKPLLKQRQDLLKLLGAGFAEKFEYSGLNGG